MGMSSVLEKPACLADCPLIYSPAGWESTVSASQVAFWCTFIRNRLQCQRNKKQHEYHVDINRRNTFKKRKSFIFFCFNLENNWKSPIDMFNNSLHCPFLERIVLCITKWNRCFKKFLLCRNVRKNWDL